MKFRPKGTSVHPTDGDILCKYLEYINWYNMHCVLLLSKFSGSNYLLDLSTHVLIRELLRHTTNLSKSIRNEGLQFIPLPVSICATRDFCNKKEKKHPYLWEESMTCSLLCVANRLPGPQICGMQR